MLTEPLGGESWDEAPSFDEALGRLTASKVDLVPGVLAALSDPSRADTDAFRERWVALPSERRIWLARELVEAAEASFQLRFDPLFRIMLADEEADVRIAAIEGLWEDEHTDLVDSFVRLLANDLHPEVRARAASALGAFVYRSELGEVGEEVGLAACEALVKSASDEFEDEDVRRRATESAGYGDRAEVRELITDLYASFEGTLRAGAVGAMGNSADDSWSMEVIEALSDQDALVRFEAATAAGQLELEDAVEELAVMAVGDDREIQLAAVWSLGEIGGNQATRILQQILATDPDEDVAEAVEDALASASLGGGDLPDWSLY
jgi:HEAT repeat protein